MSIHRIGSDLIRSQEAKPAPRGKGASAADGSSSESRTDRADRVEISDAGRELAARTLDANGGMTESRRALIEDRISQGFYNDSAVAEKIAHRLLDSGDLVDTA